LLCGQSSSVSHAIEPEHWLVLLQEDESSSGTITLFCASHRAAVLSQRLHDTCDGCATSLRLALSHV
jgi:hypothetical protein